MSHGKQAMHSRRAWAWAPVAYLPPFSSPSFQRARFAQYAVCGEIRCSVQDGKPGGQEWVKSNVLGNLMEGKLEVLVTLLVGSGEGMGAVVLGC